MFRLTRLPLHRCLHTTAASRTPKFSRASIVLGASAVATYLAWRATHVPLALDAEAAVVIQENTKKPSTTTSEEPQSESSGGSGGAYNPETGEINWDCPCLGGMAHGPCGQEFRVAFSCFVHSEDEPKGINCVEKFQAMQTCFRAHPDVYGPDIMEDDEDETPASASADAPSPVVPAESEQQPQKKSSQLSAPPS
ncbi:uncharacterized protein BT62DRAFT_983260 [Guyanagaster necrorhizus]|uniref:Mitochondrial intermembrane space import and assembly protein 40 n=1 Tax=Guyanagaster necrorhizus TaxID=856835 RepID=A0A9P7VGL2_9AGAR|nr:uncharacterized protein BT62DRAFT_983260 [Guyanagaster necrorhizus MCA 3950]KAG7440010.1 hypothetical protein BT62DRAFT_983260 [Guyanagaster necrorhizus MCA 3950]